MDFSRVHPGTASSNWWLWTWRATWSKPWPAWWSRTLPSRL